MSTALSPIALERARDEHHVHRPLARVRVVADLERQLEDLAVEAVDLAVLAHEVLGQLDVARRRTPAWPATTSERAQRPIRRTRSSTSSRTGGSWPTSGMQLGDVHALVAHPLDVLDDVQQRGDQPQVARDRRLQREQRQDPLVDLEVAAVDAVVVGDDDRGELDVLVLDRLERAVELLDDEVERRRAPAASSALELLAGSAGACRARPSAQPNFPVTYSSVRESSGLVKIFSVGAVLDQLAVEHERGRVGDARGLLHVVRDDHDRVRAA